jgi:hypothetical protein
MKGAGAPVKKDSESISTLLAGIKNRHLENLLDEVIDSHIVEIVPKKRMVEPFQGDLFELEHQTSNHDMGDYYELMTWAWYGGRRDVRKSIFAHFEEEHIIQPDLVTGKMISEQKAAFQGEQPKLYDPQIVRYHELQLLNPTKQVLFQFFRHTKERITKFKGTREELFRELGGKTAYCVEIPLSIITRIWLNGKNRMLPELIARHEGFASAEVGLEGYLSKNENPDTYYSNTTENYHANTAIRSHTLNSFIYSPEKMIDILDMDPGYFNIQRLLSPHKMSIEGQPVKQFPVVRITDRDHIIWMKYFIDTLHPDNRFSDSNAEVSEKIGFIHDEYAKFFSRYNRNGDGYNLSHPPKTKKMMRTPKYAPLAKDDDVPF